MNRVSRTLAFATLAAAFVLPVAHAREAMDVDKFVTMCDADKDGKLSKSEVMKHVEKMFDKHADKKSGMVEKSQYEKFLKELTAHSGA
jgi:arginine deiminase